MNCWEIINFNKEQQTKRKKEKKSIIIYKAQQFAVHDWLLSYLACTHFHPLCYKRYPPGGDFIFIVSSLLEDTQNFGASVSVFICDVTLRGDKFPFCWWCGLLHVQVSKSFCLSLRFLPPGLIVNGTFGTTNLSVCPARVYKRGHLHCTRSASFIHFMACL